MHVHARHSRLGVGPPRPVAVAVVVAEGGLAQVLEMVVRRVAVDVVNLSSESSQLISDEAVNQICTGRQVLINKA